MGPFSADFFLPPPQVFVDPGTQDKMRLLGSNFLPSLLQFIDPEVRVTSIFVFDAVHRPGGACVCSSDAAGSYSVKPF